ncbi:MAG: EAL domain-containing protein [Acetobacterium sp.]
MITIPILFSLIFYFTFMVYVFLGFYILNNDTVAIRKRVFFNLCMALSIWSLAFSIANSAPDYETALFWRRVATLGWGSLYSFLLHFFIVLTEKSNILRKKWHYVLIYLPAIVTIMVFSLYEPIARTQYNLSYTTFGWINISVNSLWDWFFNIYYGSFTVASLGLILYWGIKTNQQNKKAARLLVISITTALILGSVTDIILNTFISGTAPQMAPVIIMLPIAAIFYSIRHYDLMKADITISPTKEGEILNEGSRKKIYKYLTLSYFLGGSLNFIASYFIYQADFKFTLFSSGFLVLSGLVIQFFNGLKIKDKVKDIIMVLIMALTVPIITLAYINVAGITVWVAPVILVILLILFRNRRFLIIIGTAIIITQVLVWIEMPAAVVPVGASDHFSRIFLFIMFLFMAGYVNKVFVKRLEENDIQVRFQKLISQISSDFITSNESNYEQKIMSLLKLCGRQYKIDRVNLCLFSPDRKTVTGTHEWCSDGIKPAFKHFGMVQIDTIPWWITQIMNQSSVYIPSLELLPVEAGVEKKILKNRQIQSFLSIPVISNGLVIGFLGFDSVKNSKIWDGDYLEQLEIISNILADALTKVKSEQEIKQMAYYDTLTSLPNNALFRERLTKEIDLVKGTPIFIGVCFIDLDSFKSVNDTMGHEAGDELLKQVAQRLSDCISKQDMVCRFGGDEYLIMLNNLSSINDIKMIAKRIMKTFEQPLIVKDQEFFITASAGISLYPIDGEDSETLIKNADLAMYTSKDQGKNKYTLCSSALKEEALKKMKLTNSLYRAMEKDELVLYYQPQICVATKKIVGLEALIRWKHPELGIISPGTFIPLAEQTGLIIPIGDWILKTACSQSISWQALGLPPLRMAVNLSGEQFRNPNLVKNVKKSLGETGLSPKYLELEITESIALKGSVNVKQTLNELKDLGISIAIDDFGTEYSSLSRLKLLPIDRIKMDIEFVRGLSKNIKDEAIAKVIIQLAKNLDLKVIAEGVETKPQLDFLENQCCDEIQGFYYYKPLPAEEVEVIVRNQFQEMGR